jgi:hypothetical protein
VLEPLQAAVTSVSCFQVRTHGQVLVWWLGSWFGDLVLVTYSLSSLSSLNSVAVTACSFCVRAAMAMQGRVQGCLTQEPCM